MDKLKRALTSLVFLVFFIVIINDIFNILVKKTLEIEVLSPGNAAWQVFYDNGNGFRERDSSFSSLSNVDGKTKLCFDLYKFKLYGIQIDTGANAGWSHIKTITYRIGLSSHVWQAKDIVRDFKPNKDISIIKYAGDLGAIDERLNRPNDIMKAFVYILGLCLAIILFFKFNEAVHILDRAGVFASEVYGKLPVKRIEQSLNNPSWRYILCVSLVINSLLFGIFLLFMTPAFETNDDVGMMLTVSGARTGSPSEYLIFTSVIIGKALKSMYMLVPAINWYSLYLCFAHFLAMLIILYGILRLRPRLASIFQYLFLFIFFEYPLLMQLQFTSAAFVVALSGVCLLTASLSINSRKAWFYVAMSALLLAIAGLVRQKVFYLVLLLAAPFLLLKYMETKTLKILVFLGLSLLTFAIFAQYNGHYYSKDPQWKEYYEYNKIRSQLHAYPKLVYNERTKPVFEKIGWSENDFQMFRQWFFIDKKVYSKEKLAFVNKTLKNSRSFKETLDVLLDAIVPDSLLVVAGIIYLFLSIAYIQINHRKYIYSVILSAILICAYLAYSARLPYRIFMPILLFVIALTIYFNISSSSRIEGAFRKKSWIVPIFLGLFVMLFMHLSAISGLCRDNRIAQAEYVKILQDLPSGKDKLLVVWGGNLRREYTPPFSDLRDYRNLNLLMGMGGWNPFNDDMMARFNVDDVYTSFNENNNIYLIMRNDVESQNMFSRYMMEHYRQKVSFKVVNSYGKMGVFKIIYRVNQ